MHMAQCEAKTRKGDQCKNNAVRQRLCAVHLGIEKARPSWWQRHRGAIRATTDVAAGTGALLELIKAAVELWRILPFGPAPTVPSDLRQLEKELFPRPQYPRMLRVHIPFNKSHESMAWAELLSLYNRTKLTGNEKDVENLADGFQNWLADRPEAYQLLLNHLLEEKLDRNT
jgi:hypothetical protein